MPAAWGWHASEEWKRSRDGKDCVSSHVITGLVPVISNASSTLSVTPGRSVSGGEGNPMALCLIVDPLPALRSPGMTPPHVMAGLVPAIPIL